MRNAFADELTKIADQDSRVVFLSGDIGNKLFDKFKAKHADRFYNCGVAEQSMTGIAAGFALSGYRPITYTITPFVTTRCLEQIRVDVCYHHLPVTIVGVGAGLCYASLGGTHHALEDIAFMRALPGMAVVCPADPVETRLALAAALSWDGPVYIRLGKKGEPVVHQSNPDFKIGKAIVVRPGKDVGLLATGIILPSALEAAEKLKAEGVSAEVVSFHTVKPLDEDYLRQAFGRFKTVVTVEEHSRIGGLGSAVAEWLADQPKTKARLARVGTPDEFLHEAGEEEHAREKFGLTSNHIAEAARKA